MDYVVHLMQDKGEEKLAKLQGYDQSYSDGARRFVRSLLSGKDNDAELVTLHDDLDTKV